MGNSSKRDVYLEIAERYEKYITLGVIKPGERLPSVRDMAMEAGVNPNTMQRALAELERDGLVYSQRTAGRFVTEETACLYLYRLIREGRAQTGLAATVSVVEYENGTIKKHELTRADKEQDRIDHVNTLNAQTGPIFLTYRDNEKAAALIGDIQERTTPMYDFVAEDGVAHTVWKIDAEADTAHVKPAFWLNGDA